MLITLRQLKQALNSSVDIMLEDYIKGSNWNKNELLMILNAVKSGELRDQKSLLTASHVSYYVEKHYLYQDFYLEYAEALLETDDNAKVFVSGKLKMIIDMINERIK